MRRYNRCPQIDTHEALKAEIFRQSQDGAFRFSSASTSQDVGPSPQQEQPRQRELGFEDTSLYFDSTQRNAGSDLVNGEIDWSISAINNFQDVRNCVQLQIGSFYFPRIYPDANKPEFMYYKRVYMEFINAPSSQAILGANSSKFHFEFEVGALTGQAVELVPINDSFFFRSPLTSLTTFQVRFAVPSQNGTLRRIPIPLDTIAIASVPGTNPIRFTTADTSAINPIGALAAPGVAVYISGFASASGTVNDEVNSASGQFVTNILSATTFEIGAINGSTLLLSSGATMLIPKNRIAFVARFTSVRDQTTNYVAAVHT